MRPIDDKRRAMVRRLYRDGLSQKAIARQLFMCEKTVRACLEDRATADHPNANNGRLIQRRPFRCAGCGTLATAATSRDSAYCYACCLTPKAVGQT